MSEAIPVLSADLAEAREPGYRPLSTAALVCLVAGILSVASMAHPIFWGLPLVAFATGAVALRHIRQSEGELTGTTAATSGLTLGVVFLLAGLGAFFVPQWQGRQEATQLGFQFLEHLQSGQVGRAVNLTEPPGFRLPENTDFEKFYQSSRKTQKVVNVFSQSHAIVPILTRLGGRSKISLFDVEHFGKIEGELGAHIVYQVDYTTLQNEPQQLLVMLHCTYRRNPKNLSEGDWFIRRISGPPYTPRSVPIREAAVHDHSHGQGEEGHGHDH